MKFEKSEWYPPLLTLSSLSAYRNSKKKKFLTKMEVKKGINFKYLIKILYYLRFIPSTHEIIANLQALKIIIFKYFKMNYESIEKAVIEI